PPPHSGPPAPDRGIPRAFAGPRPVRRASRVRGDRRRSGVLGDHEPRDCKKRESSMRLGTAIVLLALGAILTFALNVEVSGINLDVVGWILMIAGALGIVLELALWGPRQRRRVTTSDAYGPPAGGPVQRTTTDETY